MAKQVINTSQELSSYDQRVVLDGREYVLAFQWNQREAKWYLSISDQDGSPIVHGIKVVANFPLLRRLRDRRAPPGELYAQDRSGAGADPGLRDFGTRVILVYHPAADIVGE